MLDDSQALAAYQPPELDIVAFLPRRQSMSAVDAMSQAVLRVAAEGEPREQVHVATYAVSADQLRARAIFSFRTSTAPGSCAACS